MARRKIIAGNWKMNKTPSEAVALCEELIPLVKNDDVDVVFCVPAIDIVPVVEAVKGTNVEVGAGVLDMEAILKLGLEIGTEHFIIEQEEYTMPMLDSCRVSLENLLKV